MEVGDLFVCNLGNGFHRYVVVGKNTSFPHTVLLVMATSKIQKRKQHIRKTAPTSLKSLIEIQEREYKSRINAERCALTKETCFDCNSPHQIDSRTIRDDTPCDPVSDTLLQKLKNAVRHSPVVEQDIKETYKV